MYKSCDCIRENALVWEKHDQENQRNILWMIRKDTMHDRKILRYLITIHVTSNLVIAFIVQIVQKDMYVEFEREKCGT